jgi:hypothetical protein
VADAKAAVGKVVVERAATALPDTSPGVVEKGNTAVDEDRVDWLRTEDDIAGGIERVLAADRRVLAVPLPVLVPLAVPCCDCAGRLCDFVGSGRGVDVFGDLKANDELESGELEPEFAAESSADAIPDDTVSAIPTPAVTAPA